MAKIVSTLFRYGYGALDDLGFFSPTEKVLDMMQQNKGTPEQIFSQMKQIGGKPVKEEMLFTGIEDAFSTSPKVTKPELQEYLANNKTRVQEKIKSEEKAMEAGQLDVFQEFFPFSVQNITRGGINRGEKTVNDILDGLAQNDDDMIKLVDDIGNDPARTGTIDNPFISKIDQNELSDNFWGSIDRKYYEEVQKIYDVGPNFKDRTEMYTQLRDRNLENLIKFRFIDERDNAYTIRGNKNVGFEIATSTNTDKNFVDNQTLDRVDSFNEALVKINGHRRKLAETNEEKDLVPMHENFTLPGGKNYQEIILKMEEPADEIVGTIGDFDDVVKKPENSYDNYKASISLNPITGSPSEVLLEAFELKNLEAGKKVGLETNRGLVNIKLNKDTNKIEIYKKDYKNESHTGNEKNVVVFTRTKDRVDEDGRKILYAEEIQSDMSQQGRQKGLVMGQKEKKAFINTNNPIIFGDILDSINKLKETTNIADLKGVKGSNIEPNRRPISRQIVGFDNDTDVGFLTQAGGGKERIDFNKAHTFEDIVKKHQTKYKFLTTKDNQIKLLANQGIDKSNINAIDQRTFEDQGMSITKGMYDDVSDFVDMSLFNERIKAFRKTVANKLYNKEFNKTFPENDSILVESYNSPSLVEFNDKMLPKLLTKDEYSKFMKDERAETLEYVINSLVQVKKDDTFYTQMSTKEYNKLKDTDIIEIKPKSENLGEDIVEKITKAEFEKQYVKPDLNKKIAKKIDLLTAFKSGEKEKAMNFDYSDNAIDEVFENVKELNENLEKAVKYDVKINPISDIPSAPFIGSSERFTELAIKRLLKYANDNDYDGVSFSNGIIHDKRWGEPNLTDYYDIIIPKVAKNVLKGTDAKLEYKTIFTDEKFKKSFDDGSLSLSPENYDVNRTLEKGLGTPQNGGFITNSPTIYLTPQVKNYIDSGVSLYSPIVATGIAGTIANQILGSEEDIVENEGI